CRRRAPGHKQAAVRSLCERRDGTLDLAGITRIDRTQFHAESWRDGLGCAELRRARRDGKFAKDRHPCHAGANFFKQFQPFCGDGIFEDGKAGGVAARVRQALDVAGPDRVSDKRKHNRQERVACSNGAMAGLDWDKMTSGASATNSAAYLRRVSASMPAKR